MVGKKGFTLIELVIVLILIGIIAAVAVPKFMDLQEEAKKNSVKGALASVRSAINVWYADNVIKAQAAGTTPKYPGNVAKALNGPVPKNPINDKNTVESGNFAFGTVNSTYGWRYNYNTGQFWSAVGGGFGANMY